MKQAKLAKSPEPHALLEAQKALQKKNHKKVAKMSEISAQLVKQLREMTDAGMMDCKKALVEVNGDLEKAVEYLREKGLSKAAKKADRVAAEGVISVEVAKDFSKASLIEINSETDFVAKNDNFKDLVAKITSLAYENSANDAQDLQNLQIDSSSFDDYLKSQIAKIGENIILRRIKSIKASQNTLVNGYVHFNGRVGVLISARFQNSANTEKIAELVRNLCMHAAAMKPTVLDYSGFSKEFLQKECVALAAEIEKENEELKRLGKPIKNVPEFVSRAQLSDEVLARQEAKIKENLAKQGKPEAIWDKIVPGQLERFIADNTLIDQRLTLLGQFFVLDDKKTITQVLAEKSKELNDEIEILEYTRFELGEGIEKRAENFADEVAAQMK